jgi:peptidyl-prolyl cis-trans isomerase SurA
MWARRLISGLFAVLLAGAVQAQSPFSAAVIVNGGIVTWYDIDQRARMLEVIGQAADAEKAAREALIDERLYAFAARQLGISVTEDAIKEGMAEFAARANLEPAQFVEALAAEGVDPETFRAFVHSGLLWRLVVQQKFQAKAFVSEAELDTAMALGTTSVGASVLLSELVLPLQPGQEDLARELAADLSSRIKTSAEFEEAALTYSSSPSRANGGKLDWIPLANLPEDVGKSMLTMSVGQVTPPIELGNSIVIFQLRGIRDNRAVSARTIAYDYATYLIPGGQSETAVAEARKLAASVDTCNDLQALVRDQPAERFNRQVVTVGKVARDVSLELAKLDRNEISTALTAGQGGEYLMMVMLCNRTNALTEGNREEVRAALYNQRMEAFGQGFVQELRGDAIIVYK